MAASTGAVSKASPAAKTSSSPSKQQGASTSANASDKGGKAAGAQAQGQAFAGKVADRQGGQATPSGQAAVSKPAVAAGQAASSGQAAPARASGPQVAPPGGNAPAVAAPAGQNGQPGAPAAPGSATPASPGLAGVPGSQTLKATGPVPGAATGVSDIATIRQDVNEYSRLSDVYSANKSIDNLSNLNDKGSDMRGDVKDVIDPSAINNPNHAQAQQKGDEILNAIPDDGRAGYQQLIQSVGSVVGDY